MKLQPVLCEIKTTSNKISSKNREPGTWEICTLLVSLTVVFGRQMHFDDFHEFISVSLAYEKSMFNPI